MHRQFMSSFERSIASAENRDMKRLIPSNLLDSPSELAPSPPSHTNSLSPSVTKDTNPTLPNPDPQTALYPGPQQPPAPSPALPRLVARCRQQQWLQCTTQEADTWQPRKPKLDNLDKELKKQFRSASPHNADADANGEEDLNSKQKQNVQPPQTHSPHHPPPPAPPNGSLPTEPTPHHGNDNVPTTPALHSIDDNLPEIQTQRRSEEETHSDGPQSNARHASSSVMSEMQRDEREHEDVEEDVETVTGDGEEMGRVLIRYGGWADEVTNGQGIEVVNHWEQSWRRVFTIVEAV